MVWYGLAMDLVPFARRLRCETSDAERALWLRLRDRRLGGLKFRRQTPIGPYIVDFVCLERELVVEIDGGQHMATAQRAKDEERTRWLETQGFMVLRFWNDEVLNQMEAVLERILRACELP